MSHVSIRSAVEGDYDSICEVLKEGDALHREALPQFFQRPEGPARPRNFLVDRIKGPDSTILLGCIDMRVVGVLELLLKETEASMVKKGSQVCPSR